MQIKVKRTGRVRKPQLDNSNLTEIGRVMVEAQKKRWSQAVNTSGNPAKKLSVKYLFVKRKALGGGTPKRDMKMTGALVANFQLRKAMNNVIRAEPTSRMGRLHATRSQQYEDMIGFAGSDQNAVFRSTLAQYGTWVKKAWVPISG
jgi:hypothetical protein